MAAWQEEIKASAWTIPLNLVLNFNSTHFHIASQSHPGKFYMIDLIQSTCDCADLPWIQFCKHIATVEVHFPHLCPEESTAPIALKDATVPSSVATARSGSATAQLTPAHPLLDRPSQA